MTKQVKRGKSGDVEGGPLLGGKWDQALTSAVFQEESWTPCLTWIVGRQVEDYKHIEALDVIVQSGTRKLFSVVTKELLYADVCDIGNTKVKKTKEIPPYSEVCEACKLHLDVGEPIPPPLLAKLIKWKLLTVKAADLKRREQESKLGLGKTSRLQSAGSDKNKKDKGKERAKSPKKGGKKTPEPAQSKENTKLKKRGEDESNSKYIDDEPDDGAHHYILLCGFHNPQVFHYLEEVGVVVNSVIGVSSQDYEKTKRVHDHLVESPGNHADIPDAEQAKEEEIRKELNLFWQDLLPLLQRQPDTSSLHDIARLEYEVKSIIVPDNLHDAEQKLQYMVALFEDIAVMIYDLIDAKRLYKTYLENLKLIKVQTYGQEEAPADANAVTPCQTPVKESDVSLQLQNMLNEKPPPPPVDMRYYNDLMNTIPQESVSIPLVMHCMLEQIVASEEGVEPPSEQPAPVRADGLNYNLAAYMTEMAMKLGLTEKEHAILSDVLDLPKPPPEEPSPPELVNIQDGIGIRTLHLKPHYGFDPYAVEKAMLQFFPFAHLMKLQRPSSGEVRLRAARLQELIHFCATDGLSKSEIDRAFKQFVFESMDLVSTDNNGFPVVKVKEGLSGSAIPWDDPYPYFKIQVHPESRQSEKALDIPSLASDSRSDLSGRQSDTSSQNGKDVIEQEERVTLFDKASEIDGKVIRRGDYGKSGAILEVLVVLGNGLCSPEPVPASNKSVKSRPSSTESKKGILSRTSARSLSPKQSRSNSVHWDVTQLKEEQQDIQVIEDESHATNTISQGMLEVVEAQKRNLDQWCFAEHFKPHILAQIISEASYHLPFAETYQHKRDGTTMLVLHNPHSKELQNHIDWHTELHSNTGFRNYLEYTAESITEWLKVKEAEYQALTLSKEVEGIIKEEEEKNKPEEPKKGKKSPRGKSPRSKSPKGSRSSSQERPISANTNPYIRENSLKAWTLEQQRIAAEEEEKDKARQVKRTKSAEKRQKEKEEKDRSKSPRGSAKSGRSRQGVDQEVAKIESGAEVKIEQEKFWPFYGYDTGNHLIHVSGISTTLFPTDGGRIKTERTEFVQGTVSVRSVLQKDDHIFSVHILNPKEDMNLPQDYECRLQLGTTHNGDQSTAEKAETEKSEKGGEKTPDSEQKTADDMEPEIKASKTAVSQFGSVTAQLSDGMVLALSQFGSKGESYLKPYEPATYVPPVPPADTPTLTNITAVSPSKSKKDAKNKEKTPEPPEKLPGETRKSSFYGHRHKESISETRKSQFHQEEDHTEEEKKDEEKPLPKQDFQELFVTCPDGLSVKYFLQSSVGVVPNSPEERQLAVKQSYPFKTKGVQDCESKRSKHIQTEVSRVITADGSVVKNMVDGSVEVLSADGTVSIFSGHWQTPQSRVSSPARSVKSLTEHGMSTPVRKGKGTAASAKAKKSEREADEEPRLNSNPGVWTITYPSGERLKITKETNDCVELSPVPICLATDPDSQQTMATRDDKVVTVSYPDGTTVVEHADGTRITVYYRESAIASSDMDPEQPAETSETLKFVKVECPAFATVEFNTATSENLTVFGSGTSINVFPDGYYILHHSNGGRVEVDTEGTMVYFPRRSRFLEHLMPERELQYVLRHNADVVLETVDPDGNVFNIRSTGDYHVIPANGDDAMSDDSCAGDHNLKEKKVVHYGQHSPRFFIIHADGGGTELLRYQDVAEYLMMSEQNPATAVLKDSLPEHPGVTGVTILKPYLSGLSEKWFKKYDQETIVPQGIRCRDLKTLPPKEYVKPGPVFGTNVGKGLSIGTTTKGPTRIPILKCPNKLELRQIVQYKPVTEQLRSRLQHGLRDYAESVVGRIRGETLMSVADPRSEEEKILAEDLITLAKSQREENRDFEPEHVKSIYEKSVAQRPPSPPVTPTAKRTQADWEKDRREIAEEKDAKMRLSNKIIEPYFDSELGKAFQLTQAGDMDDMMRQLAENPSRQDDSRLTYTQTPSQGQLPSQPPTVMSGRSTSSNSPAVNTNMNTAKNGQETPLSITGALSEAPTTTPSGGVRPGNPTPAHATGQGSPSPLRPKNPTPAQAAKMVTDRPVLTHTTAERTSKHKFDSKGNIKKMNKLKNPNTELKSTDRELTHHQALTTNVLGEPRAQSVQLPVAIKGGRPGAVPNVRYKQTEEPVRRQINNSLIAGATLKGKQQLGMMRGLICNPEGVNFGVLKEGCTYAFVVTLRNTGFDTCRFKVRQPPPATGLRVLFKPGPVAAGMSVELTLELYAIANGVEGETGVGSLGHVLEVITETDLLEIPVVATILTAHEYENPELSPPGLRECHAKLVSTRPPASSGIIRPRREQQKPTAMVSS